MCRQERPRSSGHVCDPNPEESVRDARLHDARHTAATIMLTRGEPARVVMQVLGHSQISLTLGTYSLVAPELAAEAAERVGRALWD